MKEFKVNKKDIIGLIAYYLMKYYKYSGSDYDEYNRWEILKKRKIFNDDGFTIFVSSIWYTEEYYIVVWMAKEKNNEIYVENDYVQTSTVIVSKINFAHICDNTGTKHIYDSIVNFVQVKDFNNKSKLNTEIKKDFKLKHLLLFHSNSKFSDYFDEYQIYENSHLSIVE